MSTSTQAEEARGYYMAYRESFLRVSFFFRFHDPHDTNFLCLRIYISVYLYAFSAYYTYPSRQ